jgi:hypothetical protein
VRPTANLNLVARITRVACIVILTASTSWLLAAAALALYPGAKLDQDYERTKLKLPKIDSKQYMTLDPFEKVAAFYKNLAPVAPEWTINQKDHQRLAFRKKGDEDSTTIEWSTEDSADKNKTFIIVNTRK